MDRERSGMSSDEDTHTDVHHYTLVDWAATTP